MFKSERWCGSTYFSPREEKKVGAHYSKYAFFDNITYTCLVTSLMILYMEFNTKVNTSTIGEDCMF